VRRGALVVAVVCLLAVAPLAPLAIVGPGPAPGAGPAVSAGAPGTTPAPERGPTPGPRATAPGPSSSDRLATHEVRVTIELAPEIEELSHDALTVSRVYSRENERVAVGSARLSAVGTLSDDPRIESVRITGDLPEVNTSVADGVRTIGADALNATGDNVTVGVIDGDFRVANPEITTSVGAYRSFDDNGGDWRHGSAVASVITDTAPNATLHLASIGPSTTPEEYARAVNWLRAGGADVIVDAGSYHAQPGDGSGQISQVVARAANETVFVTSVGNHAGRYWAGEHDTGEWVDFRPGVQGNRLAGGDPLSGRVTVSMRWQGWPETTTDYDLYLYRAQPGEDAVVARATGHDGRPFERLSATVPQGRYYVSAHLAAGEPGSRVELFADRPLSADAAGGLSPPATAPDVLAVGATRNGSVRSFSARYPDLVAPDTVAIEAVGSRGGTSFAAPYVAGSAALALSERPELSSALVRDLLVRTADANESLGPRAGAGRVNATALLAAAANETIAAAGEREHDNDTADLENGRVDVLESGPVPGPRPAPGSGPVMPAHTVEGAVPAPQAARS
jgi:hypothetical protein